MKIEKTIRVELTKEEKEILQKAQRVINALWCAMQDQGSETFYCNNRKNSYDTSELEDIENCLSDIECISEFGDFTD